MWQIELKWKRSIEVKGYEEPEGYEDLLFTTTKNTPISPRDTTVVMKYIFKRIALKEPQFKPLSSHALRQPLGISRKIPLI